MQVTVDSDMAVVAAGDRSLALPSSKDQDALVGQLEPMARAGQLFYLVTDDPVSYRISLLAGEKLPPELEADFEPAGGTFGIDLPTGALAFSGWDAEGAAVQACSFETKPGPHILVVWARKPFDGPNHVAQMRALFGAEYTYVERVDKLGLVGCLPILLTIVAAVAQKWAWLWVVVPLLAVTWLPYLILKRSTRYQSVERREQELEQAKPHYVFGIEPAAGRNLPGGFLRV